MRLLKIKAEGLPLFRETAEINFTAEQRITKDSKEEMYNIFSNTYQNNVISIVGINASGKTSLLKLLAFSINLLGNMPVNTIPCNDILDGISEEDEAVFEICFYSQLKIYCLRTVIKSHKGHFYIADEALISKKVTKLMNKASVFDFSSKADAVRRNVNEAYLLDDMSIIVAYNKKTADIIQVTNMLTENSTSILKFSDYIPEDLLALFDPGIEYLKADSRKGKPEIRLKFKNRAEIILSGFEELNRYLSAGTIKGINIFLYAEKMFKSGGYILIDEIENHLSRKIIFKLINRFQSKRTNPNGAVLIFSTHYSELLDLFERNDNIYIVRNNNGISVKNMTEVLKRNDIKKSEVFQNICSENEADVLSAPLFK